MVGKKTKKGKDKEATADVSVSRNKRARYDYEIIETFEAGIVLTGGEVKSLRAGQAVLAGSYVRERDGELWLENCEIPRYSHASTHSAHDSLRRRKLLLKKQQIVRLCKSMAQKGLTLVPLHLYFTRGYAKVEVGLGKGKKAHDKRADIKKREMTRQLDRLHKRSR